MKDVVANGQGKADLPVSKEQYFQSLTENLADMLKEFGRFKGDTNLLVFDISKYFARFLKATLKVMSGFEKLVCL